ncbi:MAG: bifunctional 5,10-methylenetetrahydrofolate dehydrogenase/5,10-methenyltetrahydrofolate cyclohydrolase [Candidatus Pacebacteria bacterium]|nr:bifunctional 5,10-methylenetetrahydrofolate dehydrogenase/5,10-methenyltetrahydrofolate cyclohydrolase [Candidatus Paceibacterota bacterium]
MILLDGKKVSKDRSLLLKNKVASFTVAPTLAILQVGDDERSGAYIRQKKLFGEKIGCKVLHISFPEKADSKEIFEKIKMLNADTSVHGIILQLPVPSHLNSQFIIESIDPRKDVDGLHSENAKKLSDGDTSGFIPATAKGVISLLDAYKIPIKNKKATVVGRSALVGTPTALCLKNRGAEVTVVHRGTENIPGKTKSADILVVAAGHPKLIDVRHVSPGSCVIDVGINLVTGEKLEDEIPKKKLVGDVDFEAVKGIVEAISPVPGGVGPMTVLSLFENLVLAYERSRK